MRVTHMGEGEKTRSFSGYNTEGGRIMSGKPRANNFDQLPHMRVVSTGNAGNYFFQALARTASTSLGMRLEGQTG